MFGKLNDGDPVSVAVEISTRSRLHFARQGFRPDSIALLREPEAFRIHGILSLQRHRVSFFRLARGYGENRVSLYESKCCEVGSKLKRLTAVYLCISHLVCERGGQLLCFFSLSLPHMQAILLVA